MGLLMHSVTIMYPNNEFFKSVIAIFKLGVEVPKSNVLVFKSDVFKFFEVALIFL